MTEKLSRSRLEYALILGALAALGPLCIDLYLPALPQMTGALAASTAVTQLSLTAGLLGLGAGQLIFGPLSDKLGRRLPLLLSLAMLLLTSVWCALAQDIGQLVVARLLQGIAGAGGAVLSRAIARDLYVGHALTRFFSLLMLINGLAPILSPVLGGLLLGVTDWRGIFALLAVIAGLLLTMSVLRLNETLPAERRIAGGVGSMLSSLGSLLREREFMGLCLAQGLCGAGMFAYIGASPFVLQEVYGLSPQAFSLCFAVNGIGLIAAGQLASHFSLRFGEQRVLRAGLTIAVISALALTVAGLLHAPLIGILVPLFFAIAMIGIVGPCASSLAMQSQGSKAGSASALIGLSMFALGALSVPFTGLTGSTSALSMALVILGCYLLAVIAYLLLSLRQTPQGDQPHKR
ncbi:multidrug effflux MFS transporter [Dickeya solani]|uniref:Bcr/CflA family efflux transporter n=1 Tax=Dickeya solani D s0432-1 TaxID=1231725 RepID=A0AAV3K6A2_9GAMM|nr:multidrug effflux MFS transporter [Dickeya solani]ANE74163.1 Bcr/CflA family drug resistance efflux transporter [Dickeya solani IPO 2222]AUC41332.1 Bicyclomycin resistance protein [Dickeya solani RNS 08.23.3.1.A]AUH10425.1 Bcr/CflA family drug resistance efflux transporter [Dickeya solani D s0432-1]AUH14361.1 Bcr/CflA family drug resistance efflux transporter [Dickeya solani]AYQ48601.1 Bicyclomycin resistance protein [Dickeya solani]